MSEKLSPEQWEEIARAWISFGTMLVAQVPKGDTVTAFERLKRESARSATLVEHGLVNMDELITAEVEEQRKRGK